jgi:hypothetical protein
VNSPESLVKAVTSTGHYDRYEVARANLAFIQIENIVAILNVVDLYSRSKLLIDVAKNKPEFMTQIGPDGFIDLLKTANVYERTAVASFVLPLIVDQMESHHWTSLLNCLNLYDRDKFLVEYLKKSDSNVSALRKTHIGLCQQYSRDAVALALSDRANRDRYREQEAENARLKKELQDLKDKSQNKEAEAPKKAQDKPKDVKAEIENPSNIKEPGKAEGKSDQCMACLTNRRHVLALPCAHTVLCLECVNKLIDSKCPKCDGNVTKWIVSN